MDAERGRGTTRPDEMHWLQGLETGRGATPPAEMPAEMH